MTRERTPSSKMMKSANQQKVLHLIFSEGPISRVELAEKSGLTQQTVTNIVNRLLQDDIVKEGEPAESPVGRKRVPLTVNASSLYAIGIEVAGKYIRGALHNFHYHRLGRAERRIQKLQDGSHALELIQSVIDELLEQAPDPERLKGIGLSVQGLVDSGQGVVLRPPGLGWTPLSLRKPLESRYGLPVYTENDVNLLSLYENMNGCLAGSSNNITLKFDWGIGGAIMADNRLITGSTFVAGEFGHYKSFSGEDLYTCHCGAAGCLTTLASISGLSSNLGMSLEAFEADCFSEDPSYREIFNKVQDAIRLAVGNLITFLNPDHVMITGRYMEAFSDTLVPDLFSSIPSLVPETCRNVNLIHLREMPEETELAVGLVIKHMFDPVLQVRLHS
ncbi:ROK family transcriptional regulator [Paenibacillus lemnae]|uniref:ROK family transcriptional regulator n=1 Tax=Paenibacillus lemnae TaxID=1330551 RepID=A0A848M0Q4_PAELE|nr:ROK family transcriptional regulator [Paenibacillus lemnae]NMO94417.1 ROK family transcriptional regulator [Paenibacillus lemnae]